MDKKIFVEQAFDTVGVNQALRIVIDSFAGKGINGVAEKEFYIAKQDNARVLENYYHVEHSIHTEHIEIAYKYKNTGKVRKAFIPFELVKYVEVISFSEIK